MLTTIDKALVPLLVSAVTWANQRWGWHLDTDPATLAAMVGAVSAIIVYFIPNKQVTQ